MIYNLITILGPTATGKTKLSVKLAYYFNGEIISADSRQVYKRMNIGTGKDLVDYEIQGIKIPYYLIDIIEPTEEFNLFSFKEKFWESYFEITKKNKIPFLVGGTGLYVASILQKYDLKKVDFKNNYDYLNSFSEEKLISILIDLNPKLHNTTDLVSKERIIKAIQIAQQSFSDNNRNEPMAQDNNKSSEEKINIESLNIGIKMERKLLKENIKTRLKYRLENGMIDEVENLINEGMTFERLNSFGLEYRYISLFLQKKIDYNDLFQKLNSSIYKFAKRQETWFKKMEREGVKIFWVDGPNYEAAKSIIEQNYFDKEN
ncbi:MAG: tRNA (adenosine(37)-N6)-dimethylallyltransferase MiaA [Ignavibacterium sp.]